MHQPYTLFHNSKISPSFMFGGESDNHAINTVPKETLVKISKAEPGGLEGKARGWAAEHADAGELKNARRDGYRAASGGKEHPNWDEYDLAMVEDNRATVVVVPDRVYGTAV